MPSGRTDIFAQQARDANELFRDADPQVMSAIEAWEKMTPEQKRTFTATPEATGHCDPLAPAPRNVAGMKISPANARKS